MAARPPTDKQVAFIERLARDLETEVTVPATRFAASQLIDNLVARRKRVQDGQAWEQALPTATATLAPTRAVFPKLATSRFSYDKQSNSYIGEASDFKGLNLGPMFTLVAASDGREIVFQAEGENTDDEGDLLSVTYGPVTPGLSPKQRDVRVIIFND